jgi:ubiquinone/menaquinone biosynthesis C-methylase UbiE
VSSLSQEYGVLSCGCGTQTLGDLRLDIRRTNATNIVADAQYLPFRENVFAAVYQRNLLEHLPKPDLHLGEVHRVLRSNGELRLTTDHSKCLRYHLTGSHSRYHKHAENDWQAINYFLAGFFWRGAENVDRHFGLFTKESLRKLLECAEMRVQKLEFVDTVYFTRHLDKALRYFKPELSYPRILVEAIKD